MAAAAYTTRSPPCESTHCLRMAHLTGRGAYTHAALPVRYAIRKQGVSHREGCLYPHHVYCAYLTGRGSGCIYITYGESPALPCLRPAARRHCPRSARAPAAHTALPVRYARRMQCVSYREGCLYIRVRVKTKRVLRSTPLPVRYAIHIIQSVSHREGCLYLCAHPSL
jgi:hypothetical protein